MRLLRFVFLAVAAWGVDNMALFKKKNGEGKPIFNLGLFRKDAMVKMRFLLLIEIGVFALAALVLVLLLIRDPDPVYFRARGVDGGLVPNPNLSARDSYSESALNSWAVHRAVDMFSFDYSNYQRVQTSIQKYFTARGFNGSGNARNRGASYWITSNGLTGYDRLVSDSVIVEAEPLCAPTIIDDNIRDDITGRRVIRLKIFMRNRIYDVDDPQRPLIINYSLTLDVMHVLLAERVNGRNIQRVDPFLIDAVTVGSGDDGGDQC